MMSLTKKERETLLILFKDFTTFYNANSISKVLNISHDVERDVSDYFVISVHSGKRNDFYTQNYDLEKIQDEIKIAGVEYYKIYKNNGRKK